MSETEVNPFEVERLRRGLRDMAALAALPVVWVESDPRRNAESLANALLHMLDLELVYILAKDQAAEFPVEVALTATGPAPTDRAAEIGRALAPCLNTNDIASAPSSIANPLGGGATGIICSPIGAEGRWGVLAACSTRADFPTEGDRLLLGLAANRVAILLDRRQTEVALRASEQRFRTFVDHAADAFFLHEAATGRVLDVNRQACESLGYTRDDLIGMSPLDFDPDLTPALLEDLVRRLLAGESTAFESRHRRKDGTVFPVEVRGKTFREGGQRFSVSLVRDITERKRAEEALRESEGRFRGTFENAAVGIAHTDLNGRWLRVNEKLADILGYSVEELRRLSFQDITHPADIPTSLQALSGIVHGRSYSLEKRYIRKDGSVIWALLAVSLQRDPAGKPAYAISVVQDISERKRLDAELREARDELEKKVAERTAELRRSERRLAEAQRLSHTGSWARNVATGETTHCSEEFSRLFGFDPALGAPPFEAFVQRLHTEDRARVTETFERAVRERADFEMDFRTALPDGTIKYIHGVGHPVFDAADNLVEYIGTAVDVTQRKRAEEELHAREAAEAANRAKDEFLANVGHELRTPMNAILGMTELALDTPLTDDQRQLLRTVKSAADNLLGIINDLLDFSKISAGKMELHPADFSLRSVVGDTLRALAVRAHSKGLELIYHVQPDVPDALIGDAGRLRQVLLNLVSNAIKFTAEGKVELKAELADCRLQIADCRLETGDCSAAPSSNLKSEISNLQSNSICNLQFSIRDTGIGIPADKQEKVFHAFEQEDSSTTRRFGGTGLGLSIAARLVELMGGTITLQSEAGRGSTFAFTAKFGRQPHPAETTPSLPPFLLPGLPVLVVDDNATNRHILAEWLRDWQMNPTAVGDGVSAIDALWDAVSVGRPYALVLLDARMPETGGLALATRIRERAALSAIRIILLTSGDRLGDLARSRELRVDAHLLKPIQPAELLETIYRVMHRVRGDASPAAAPAREPCREATAAVTPLNILVAEDSEFSARFLERLLTRPGHRVRLATDGRQALKLAEEKGIDILLLDVHMPEFDGFQVIQTIRQRERATGGHLPVIALTARSRKEDRERCLAAGMDDFLTKPVRPAELFAAIDRLMRAPGRSARVPQAGQQDTGERQRLLDANALLTACGNDAEWLRGMCEDFRKHVPALLAEVGAAQRGRDASRLREAAHKLSARLFAFSPTAGVMGSNLEDHAAQGRLDEARPLVEQLESMASELLALVGGLSLESLHQPAASADGPGRAAGR